MKRPNWYVVENANSYKNTENLSHKKIKTQNQPEKEKCVFKEESYLKNICKPKIYIHRSCNAPHEDGSIYEMASISSGNDEDEFWFNINEDFTRQFRHSESKTTKKIKIKIPINCFNIRLNLELSTLSEDLVNNIYTKCYGWKGKKGVVDDCCNQCHGRMLEIANYISIHNARQLSILSIKSNGWFLYEILKNKYHMYNDIYNIIVNHFMIYICELIQFSKIKFENNECDDFCVGRYG